MGSQISRNMASTSAVVLRRRKSAANSYVSQQRQVREDLRKLALVLAKDERNRSQEENTLLLESDHLVAQIKQRAKRKESAKKRKQEEEPDDEGIVTEKSMQLAEAIRSAKHLVVYTGAGLSTAASIPDYRGPEGVWTLLKKGVPLKTQHLSDSDPTLTHMALRRLQSEGLVKHIVSQNCDGLHLRSGVSPNHLSELHGNMFIEVCTACSPQAQYVRLFDVTEKTRFRRHLTQRTCHRCQSPLVDTIVHFGEKGRVSQPLNWEAAIEHSSRADTLLCLGSSLKVLRHYKVLWRGGKCRPLLHIVNLQPTPKDGLATLKINAEVDKVMAKVMQHLGLEIPQYCREADPLFQMAQPLLSTEQETFTTKPLQWPPSGIKTEPFQPPSDHQDPKIAPLEVKVEEGATPAVPSWFGKGCRIATKTKAKRRRLSKTK